MKLVYQKANAKFFGGDVEGYVDLVKFLDIVKYVERRR